VIRGTTRVAAVIGWPVEHSRSPEMLNAAFAAAKIDGVMIPIGVPPESFALAISTLFNMRAFGASVTLPHKVAAYGLCDELSDAARAIGAVNCIAIDGDRVVGHNTDCDGFVDSLRAAGCDPAGKTCLILGAGGAARAVAYGLRDADVTVIARRPEAVDWAPSIAWTPEHLRQMFARADVVVDATPVGLGDKAEAAIVALLPVDALRPGSWVTTLVYHRTPLLLQRAKRNGHSILDGRGMLVHQGARAFSIWTGTSAPLTIMRDALDAAIQGT